MLDFSACHILHPLFLQGLAPVVLRPGSEATPHRAAEQQHVLSPSDAPRHDVQATPAYQTRTCRRDAATIVQDAPQRASPLTPHASRQCYAHHSALLWGTHAWKIAQGANRSEPTYIHAASCSASDLSQSLVNVAPTIAATRLVPQTVQLSLQGLSFMPVVHTPVTPSASTSRRCEPSPYRRLPTSSTSSCSTPSARCNPAN